MTTAVPSDTSAQRDWFAAMALQGLAAKGLEVSGDRVLSDEEKADRLAVRAYQLADAMVRARAK